MHDHHNEYRTHHKPDDRVTQCHSSSGIYSIRYIEKTRVITKIKIKIKIKIKKYRSENRTSVLFLFSDSLCSIEPAL